jgi:hypothetical protein
MKQGVKRWVQSANPFQGLGLCSIEIDNPRWVLGTAPGARTLPGRDNRKEGRVLGGVIE